MRFVVIYLQKILLFFFFNVSLILSFLFQIVVGNIHCLDVFCVLGAVPGRGQYIRDWNPGGRRPDRKLGQDPGKRPSPTEIEQ